jgi:hypothetical protein
MAACFFTSARNQIHPRMTQLNQQIRIASARLTPCRLVSPSTQLGGAGRPPSGTPNPWQANPNFLKRTKSGGRKRLEEASGGERARALPMSSVSHHLLPFPAGCSDVDDAGPFTVALPSFWPPFPALSSNSNVPSFLPRRTDRSREAAAASAFFGLGFHDVDDDEWAPPDEGGREVELPLCWDCLQLEDHDDHHQRWDVGDSDADEWEQVVGREEEPLGGRVLLATNSLGSLSVDEDLDGSIETYFFAPQGKGGRPAAKAAVEGLPTVVVAEADAARVSCAVCKDGVEAGERARRLPCAHLYHDGCILPWLAIRSTCPLCRHELPTDDPECEKCKAGRAAAGGGRYSYCFGRLP